MVRAHVISSIILSAALYTVSLPAYSQTAETEKAEPPADEGVPSAEEAAVEAAPAEPVEQPPVETLQPPGGAQPAAETQPQPKPQPPAAGQPAPVTATDPELAPGAPAGPVSGVDYKKMKRYFGFGLTFLNEAGYGGLIRGRVGYVGFEAAGSFYPVIYVVTGDCSEIAFRPGYYVGGSFLVFFKKNPKKFQNGIKASGFYSPVTGPGGRLGWLGELRVTKTNFFAVNFSAGLSITPLKVKEFKKWLEDVCPAGETTNMEYLQYVYISVGIALMFYVV